jgi:hypothetical protein
MTLAISLSLISIAGRMRAAPTMGMLGGVSTLLAVLHAVGMRLSVVPAGRTARV